MVPLENDKPTVVALREIADGLVDSSILDEPVAPVADEIVIDLGSEETPEVEPPKPAED